MGTEVVSTAAGRLYDRDFYAWIQQQASMLRAGNLDNLDMDNLIEEIESMGRSEKRELRSRLTVLLMHLLKWAYQPLRRGASWQSTIWEQRERIDLLLQDSPSLGSVAPTMYADAYELAVLKAAKETGMIASVFPSECPWTFNQAMDDDFWPDAGSKP